MRNIKMKNDKNIHVLIHGQICTMSEDELMHWKYIRREKQPDGSYRYYYDTSEQKNAQSAVSKAKRESEIALNEAGAAKMAADEAYKKFRSAQVPTGTLLSNKESYEYEKKRDELWSEYQKAKQKADLASSTYKAKKERADKAAEKLKWEMIANIPNRLISKGFAAISDLVRGIFGLNKGGTTYS